MTFYVPWFSGATLLFFCQGTYNILFDIHKHLIRELRLVGHHMSTVGLQQMLTFMVSFEVYQSRTPPVFTAIKSQCQVFFVFFVLVKCEFIDVYSTCTMCFVYFSHLCTYYVTLWLSLSHIKQISAAENFEKELSTSYSELWYNKSNRDIFCRLK